MGVAITLCDKTQYESRKNKHDHPFFGRSEAEPLPRLIQFGSPVFLQPTFRSQFLDCSFVAAELSR